MRLRTTHTVVKLELSKAAYDEIAKKLLDAGYQHCFLGYHEDGAIDMSGIAVISEARDEETSLVKQGGNDDVTS